MDNCSLHALDETIIDRSIIKPEMRREPASSKQSSSFSMSVIYLSQSLELYSGDYLLLITVKPVLSGNVLSGQPLSSGHAAKSRNFHKVNTPLLSGRGHLFLSAK